MSLIVSTFVVGGNLLRMKLDSVILRLVSLKLEMNFKLNKGFDGFWKVPNWNSQSYKYFGYKVINNWYYEIWFEEETPLPVCLLGLVGAIIFDICVARESMFNGIGFYYSH